MDSKQVEVNSADEMEEPKKIPENLYQGRLCSQRSALSLDQNGPMGSCIETTGTLFDEP